MEKIISDFCVSALVSAACQNTDILKSKYFNDDDLAKLLVEARKVPSSSPIYWGSGIDRLYELMQRLAEPDQK